MNQPVQSSNLRLNEALEMLDAGRLAEAARIAQGLANQFPFDGAVHYLAALVQHRKGEIAGAILSLQTAIELQPTNAIYYNVLAVCSLIRNEPVTAELCYRRALSLEPDNADVLNNFGHLLLHRGDIDGAVPLLTQALKLAPDDINIQCNMGSLMMALDRPQDALIHYESAHRAQPSHTNAHVGRINALHQLQRNDESLALLENLIDTTPSHRVEGLRQKSVILGALGRNGEACAAIDAAITLTPDLPPLFHARAQLKRITREDPFYGQLQSIAGHVEKLHGAEKTQLCFALGKAALDTDDIATAAHFYAIGGANVYRTHRYDELNDSRIFETLQSNVTRDYIATMARDGSSSTRPIFILGMERSGTTLVEQILASHPMVYAGGELQFMSNVLSKLVLPNGQQLLDRRENGLTPDATVHQRADRYLDLLNNLPGGRDHPKVTDKMPGNFKNLGLIRALFPNARIIHCRRDPIDNCISSYTTLFTKENYWSFDLAAMGRHYRRYWSLMAHWRKEFPGEFLEVRYEQVIDNIEESARRLLAWCDLPWDDRVLEFHRTERPVKTASFLQVRQPIYTTSVGRWRKWEPYIQPLLSEIGFIENAYWEELSAQKD